MASEPEYNGRAAAEKFIKDKLGEDAFEDGSDEPNGDETWQEFY